MVPNRTVISPWPKQNFKIYLISIPHKIFLQQDVHISHFPSLPFFYCKYSRVPQSCSLQKKNKKKLLINCLLLFSPKGYRLEKNLRMRNFLMLFGRVCLLNLFLSPLSQLTDYFLIHLSAFFVAVREKFSLHEWSLQTFKFIDINYVSPSENFMSP